MDALNSSTPIRTPETIEKRIAASLRDHGRFQESIQADELASIIEGVVLALFSEQKIGGVTVPVTTTINAMEVYIENSEASVCFLVRIHKPITAAIKFSYSLINDPVSIRDKLVVKKGTLIIEEKTRKLDLPAKTALAAINVEHLARQELSDLGRIILKTLPPQLETHGVAGLLHDIGLVLDGSVLDVHLRGDFWSLLD